VAAAYISGETPKDERQELLRKFADKQITVMVNALVLTEGYDNAGIEYIFMARPTKSGLLYQQMIGRGTRVHPGKSYLVIVDFVDNTSKHQLQTAATLLGLSGTVDFQGQDILETAGRIDALLEKRPYYDLNRLHVTKIDYLLREVDLLQEKALSKQEENYTWHKFGAGMRMHNGKNRYFFIEQSLTGQYMLFEFLRIIHKKKQIGIFATQGEAMRYADAQIVSAFSGMPQPLSPSYGHTMNYSTDLPSEAQMALLRELGVEEKTILFLNKRDASLLISQKKRGR
jgi:superfamily II DNA/RNA helicase